MLKVIGGAESGEFKAVASGTLPNGKPVVVNADGTVSVAEETTQAVGTVATSSTPPNTTWVVFDSNSDKLVIIFGDTSNSDYLTTIVGTISGTSITFGTPVVISEGISPSADGYILAATFNSSANKIVLVYDPQSGNAVARVGTVSGTSISYGSTRDLGGNYNYFGICFDSSNNKVVIGYIDTNGKGTAVVGTVSGTSISLGSPTQFNSSTGTANIFCVFDSTNNKVVIAYRDASSFSGDGPGSAIVGTVSGTSISFGSEVQFSSNNVHYVGASFDEESSKVVIVFCDLTASGNTNEGPPKAIVGTVSGTSISFGSLVTIDSANSRNSFVTYDPVAKKHLITWRDRTNDYGYYVEGTVSGTSIAFATKATFSETNTQSITSGSDPNSGINVIAYRDGTNTNLSARVYRFQTANLTSENYIGMSGGAIDTEVISQALGSAVVFESAAVGSNVASTFDSNSNKVVIVYQDTANSFYGTAIVGTVSGTSISFGSPVVFSSANRTQEIQITFDSNSNKVVVAYDDKADGQKGKAIVGTVSGTSISFGSAVVFNNGSTDTGTPNAITFDSNSNKVVIAFQDKADTNKGKAIVGTVSGTSISFGSEATFLNADYATHVSATFDSNSNKVVIVYKDGSNSTHGYAVVGTVSSTSISFGTPVVFESAATNNPNVAFDTVNNKIVIAYADGTVGTAIVGTVSGTAISFGSPVIFNSTETTSPRVRFDATASKIVIAYGEGSSNVGTFKTGTVSGTSISFGSATVFESGATNGQNGLVYDSNAGKMVLSYYSGSNSGYGTSKVLQTGYTNITRGEVADGDNATVDIVGTVSSNQLSLTAGQQYFVQTDGTIGTTADSPSVLAGTAISATELLVKT